MNGSKPHSPAGIGRAPRRGHPRGVVPRFPSPHPSPLLWGEYVFSAMVGMARCAVPARVVAGGTNIRAAMAFQGVAPLHAARTSQRDVPTTLNTYTPQVIGTHKP